MATFCVATTLLFLHEPVKMKYKIRRLFITITSKNLATKTYAMLNSKLKEIH